jgi:hypothetical protein
MKTNIHLWYLAQFFLEKRNVSDKRYRGNQNTHYVFKNLFPENCAVYEIMWKYAYIVEQGRPQMAVRRMSIPCWITKATHTHTHTHTHTICNNYCFSTATVVARIRTLPVLLCFLERSQRKFSKIYTYNFYVCPLVCPCRPTRERIDGICTECYVEEF